MRSAVGPAPAVAVAPAADQEVSGKRTTFRFPTTRQGQQPKVLRQQLPDETRYHQRSSRHPARQVNAMLNRQRLGHSVLPDTHLERPEAPRWIVTPGDALPLLDPHVDDEEGTEAQQQRAHFMRDGGHVDAPDWAARAAETRAEQQAEWEGRIPVDQRRYERGRQDEAADDEGDEDEDEGEAGAAVAGTWDMTTLPLRLSSSLNFFAPNEVGVANPLFHLFHLLPPFWVQYTTIIMSVFNLYIRELTTDVRLLEIWRFRTSSSNAREGWKQIVREIAQLLETSIQHYNVEQKAVQEAYLPKWHVFAARNKPSFLEGLRHYCDANAVFGRDGAALLHARPRNAANIDPALLTVIIRYRQARPGGFPRAPLHVDGLTSAERWLGGIKNVKNDLNKKILSANLRKAFEKRLMAKIDDAAGEDYVTDGMKASILAKVMAIVHTDVTYSPQETALGRWVGSVLEEAGCSGTVLEDFRPWLREIGIAFRTRCTLSSHNSSLDARLTGGAGGDPDVRVQEIVPFFSALGVDISIVGRRGSRTTSFTDEYL